MEYLLKASAVIAIFYLCYKLFLQRDTFFTSNRVFLLIGLICAFSIPLVVIPIYIERTPVVLDQFIFEDVMNGAHSSEWNISFMDVVQIIYLLGVVFFLARFIVQLTSLIFIILKNTPEKNGRFTHIKTKNTVSPFSFFNWIVYNPDQFSHSELTQIITHEKVHALQYHSIDIILTHFSCIILWFNPFIWLYNKDLKQNLEFIADQNAQRKVDCKKSYQYTLLKTGMPSHQMALTNNFYNSLIKKRIVMLHKSKSKKISQIKYVLVIPLLVIFLMSFNTKTIFIDKPVIDELPNIQYNPNLISEIDVEDQENQIIYQRDPLPTGKVKSVSKSESLATKTAIVSKTSSNIIKTNKTTPESGEVEIVLISKHTSDSELKEISTNLKNSGITAKFKNVKRNSNGEITAIKIEVSSKKANANYSVSSDDPIKSIKISFKNNGENISIGNGNIHKHEGNTFYFKTKNGKHKIHKSGTGENVFVLSGDGDHEIHEIHGDTIIHSSKGKFRILNNDKDVKIITDHDVDENVEVHIEHDGSHEEDIIILKEANGSKVSTGKNSIKIRGISTSMGKDPLYFIDGVEMRKDGFKELNPDNIESISVLKGDSAVEKYGKKAEYGVIEIITKNKK